MGLIPVPDTNGAFSGNDDANDSLTEMGIALWAIVQRLDLLIGRLDK